MAKESTSRLSEILTGCEKDVAEAWLQEQLGAATLRKDLMSEADLRRETAEFMALFAKALKRGLPTHISAAEWDEVRGFLTGLSRSRAAAGFTPTETATFVFSLKQPLLARVQAALAKDSETQAAELWAITSLIDKLGLFTTEANFKIREEVIARQQAEMLELSTPVVKLWEGILALPLIGTLDSARTQIVMESLLQAIVDSGSAMAIIDITGVPAVDTLVAQHLLKTVAAARLMGTQCVISGIRPQIAQTMVHLGVAFGDVVTKATLADALSHAFRQVGLAVSRRPA